MIYLFENSRGEQREVIQAAHDEHVYFGESGEEQDWRRVFTVPNLSTDSQINPYSEQDWLTKTKKKKGMTIGESWELSKKLSDQRAAENGGVDPIKEKKLKNEPIHTRKALESLIK